MLTLPMNLIDGWKRTIIGEHQKNNDAEQLQFREEWGCMRSDAKGLVATFR